MEDQTKPDTSNSFQWIIENEAKYFDPNRPRMRRLRAAQSVASPPWIAALRWAKIARDVEKIKQKLYNR